MYHDNDEKKTMTKMVMEEVLFCWEMHHGRGEVLQNYFLNDVGW